ncbi:LPAAT1B [Auxenochlorella protothecoides x Auxenochlorella symbiontica]
MSLAMVTLPTRRHGDSPPSPPLHSRKGPRKCPDLFQLSFKGKISSFEASEKGRQASTVVKWRSRREGCQGVHGQQWDDTLRLASSGQNSVHGKGMSMLIPRCGLVPQGSNARPTAQLVGLQPAVPPARRGSTRFPTPLHAEFTYRSNPSAAHKWSRCGHCPWGREVRSTNQDRGGRVGSYASNAGDPTGFTAAMQPIFVDTRGLKGALAAFRAFLFYLNTFAWAGPLFVIMVFLTPYVLAFDRTRRKAQHFFNTLWAKISSFPFYRVVISGLENLPPQEQPAVYVANHQSFLDITTLFHINRDFKFVSKTANFFIPIIGWSMFLTGHIQLDRMDRRSQQKCLKDCGMMLERGTSVAFFPEGTRSKDGKLHAFKRGAFVVASRHNVPVVPITLDGTGDLMPNSREYLLFPGTVHVRIHPAIPPGPVDALTRAAECAIASGLPPERLAPEILGT